MALGPLFPHFHINFSQIVLISRHIYVRDFISVKNWKINTNLTQKCIFKAIISKIVKNEYFQYKRNQKTHESWAGSQFWWKCWLNSTRDRELCAGMQPPGPRDRKPGRRPVRGLRPLRPPGRYPVWDKERSDLSNTGMCGDEGTEGANE